VTAATRSSRRSYEKVLVGRFRDVPLYRGKDLPGKVPFDAMVWFNLEKR